MELGQARERGTRDICERTFAFAVQVVRLCSELDERGGTGRALGWQLLRAGTSVGANVEEAQAAQSGPDFISKTTIALKEARETCYWLRLLVAAQIADSDDLVRIRNEAEQITRILAAIVVSAKRNR